MRAERRLAIVEITDRGVGIAPADQARIFERFYRAPGRRRIGQGFGLGLPIVRELVHAHGGRVDVSSAPGAGSTFRVVAAAASPRADADEQPAARKPGGRVMNRDAGAPDDARHVLVIEDEPQMRSMLTDNLEFEGYRVTAVASGEEALQAVAHAAFALLLVDVMLPGMSGFDVCQQLRARGTRVPIIVLTARTHERDRVRGLDLGADDYVSKPFSVRELLARVRAQVRRDDWHSPGGDEFSFGDVVVKPRQRLVLRKGRRVALSAREFELLRYLFAHRNEVVSREQLLRDVWGYSQLSVTRTVDNYVAKLRTHSSRGRTTRATSSPCTAAATSCLFREPQGAEGA